jgi:hypothetical protein
LIVVKQRNSITAFRGINSRNLVAEPIKSQWNKPTRNEDYKCAACCQREPRYQQEEVTIGQALHIEHDEKEERDNRIDNNDTTNT